MVWETRVQSQVQSYQRLKKMVFDATLLNTQHYKEGSRVKWRNPRNSASPSPTPRCTGY